MELRTVQSPTHRGALQYIFQMLQARKVDLSVRHLIVVPDSFSLMAEMSLASMFGGAMDVEVVTLSRMHARLFSDTKHISTQGAVMLIERLLRQNADSLQSLRRTATLSGELLQTVTRLKSCCIAPEAVARDGKNAKLADVALIYSQYEQYLAQNGLTDGVDKLTRIATKSEQFKAAHLYFALFDSFTGKGYALIEAFVRHALSVTVAMVCGSSAYSLNEVERGIDDVAARLAIEVQAHTATDGKMHAGLAHVLRHLGNYRSPVWQGDCPVTVTAARSATEEAEFVARSISRGVRQQSRRYKDYGIISGGIDPLLISRVLERYGIPHYVNDAEPLVRHPLTQFVISVLRVVARRFAVADVLELSYNIYSGVSAEQHCALDNYCLKFATNHSRFNSPFELGKSDSFFDEAESARQHINRLVEPLMRAKGDQFPAAVIQIVNATERRSGDATAHRRITTLLSECGSMFALSGMTIMEFCEFFSAVTESVKLSLIPPRTDAVFVGDAGDFRLATAHSIFVTGFDSGVLPPTAAADGLLNSADIDALASTALDRTRQTVLTARKRFDFIHSMCMPLEQLHLSYHSKPANLIDEIARLFKHGEGSGIPVAPARQRTDDNDALAFAYPTLPVVMTAFCEGRDAARAEREMPASDALLTLHDALKTREALPTLRAIEEAALTVERTDDVIRTRVTELERFFACPYSHFLQFKLRLEQRQRSGFKPTDIGTLLHSVVEKYIDEGMPDSFEQRINQILAESIALREEWNCTPLGEDVERRIKKEAAAVCAAIRSQAQSSEFSTIFTELEFNESSEVKPLQIQFDGQTVVLGGKVDRVDQADELVRIIDYKSGTKSHLSLSQIYHGVKLQLPIYLSALLSYEPPSRVKLRPAGMFYFRLHDEFGEQERRYMMNGFVRKETDILLAMDKTIKDGGVSEVIPVALGYNKDKELCVVQKGTSTSALLTEGDFDALCHYAKRLSAEGARLIRSGYRQRAPLCTSGFNACRICDYADVCYYDDDSGDARQSAATVRLASFGSREGDGDV